MTMQKNNKKSNHPTSSKSFGSMDTDKQREIASAGGTRAYEKEIAGEFPAEETVEVSRIGNQSSHGRNKQGSNQNR